MQDQWIQTSVMFHFWCRWLLIWHRGQTIRSRIPQLHRLDSNLRCSNFTCKISYFWPFCCSKCVPSLAFHTQSFEMVWIQEVYLRALRFQIWFDTISDSNTLRTIHQNQKVVWTFRRSHRRRLESLVEHRFCGLRRWIRGSLIRFCGARSSWGYFLQRCLINSSWLSLVRWMTVRSISEPVIYRYSCTYAKN